MGDIPQSERQARPLAKLPAEEQAPAWEEANEAHGLPAYGGNGGC